MITLTDLQQDSLTEFFNIGMGKAAQSLSRLADEEVGLSVPALRFLTRMQAATLLAMTLDQQMWAVRQQIAGDFNASAILVFPEASSLEIARLLAGRNPASSPLSAELQKDAVIEIGNILLNACIGAISNVLDAQLQLSLPALKVGSCAEILQVGDEAYEETVMLIHITFSLESREITGHLAVVQDDIGARQLRNKISEFLRSI